MSDKPRKDKPKYTIYRARPRFLIKLRDGEAAASGALVTPKPQHEQDEEKPQILTRRRVVKWAFVLVGGWLLLSLVLFMVSAQIESAKVSESARKALAGGAVTPFSPTTVLVLGSDQRTKGTKEPGAATSGPSRADTIMLLRVGGGHSARLSIPRDTVVNIPGHGLDKINASYAIGGPALAITTVEQYLGVKINHLMEVNFENFPSFIDALGGVNVSTGCVVSKINGGFKNGGFTLRLKPGKNHLNGKQALALARTRKNQCNTRENDLTRAKRQQKILAAMRGRLLSPITFFRLPWVAWQAPRAIRSDMNGPSLLGLFASVAVSGSGETRILKPSGAAVTAGGGSGLVVSDAERQAEVKRFLDD